MIKILEPTSTCNE